MFDVKIRMLGFVERWNIAPRLHRQTVAEHSYFVAMYADTIATWLDLPTADRLGIVQHALRHDLAEVRTGDIPGPSKRAIVDQALLREYEIDFLKEIGEDDYLIYFTPVNLAVVKAADTIDAWFHLALEVAHGNSLIQGECAIAMDRAWKATHALSAFTTKNTAELWQLVREQVVNLERPVYLAPRLDSDLPNPDQDEIPF